MTSSCMTSSLHPFHWSSAEENVDGDTKFVILTSFEGRPPLALVGDTICYCNRPGMTIKLRSTQTGHAEQGELQVGVLGVY